MAPLVYELQLAQGISIMAEGTKEKTLDEAEAAIRDYIQANIEGLKGSLSSLAEKPLEGWTDEEKREHEDLYKIMLSVQNSGRDLEKFLSKYPDRVS